MNQEQFRERILGITTHENQKILNSFPGVASYTSYKSKAVLIAQKVYELLYQPYVLKGFYESIIADQPYFTALYMMPLTSDWGNRLNLYNLQVSEKILEAAHAISGGALKWFKYIDGDCSVIFLWIDPEVVQASIEQITKEVSRTHLVVEDAPDGEPPEEIPEEEIPQYN